MNETDYKIIQQIRDDLDLLNKTIDSQRNPDHDLIQTISTCMDQFEPRFFAICEEIAKTGNVIPLPLRTLINILADADRIELVGYEDELKEWDSIYSRVTLWLRFLDESFPNYKWGKMQMNRWFGHHKTATGTANIDGKPAPNHNSQDNTSYVEPVISRKKLSSFFIPEFKAQRKRPGMEPMPDLFTLFFNSLASDAKGYNATDIGRVAYQVKQSKYLLTTYKNMKFARFARLFYDACGIDAPKDLSPRAYKDKKDKTDYSAYL